MLGIIASTFIWTYSITTRINREHFEKKIEHLTYSECMKNSDKAWTDFLYNPSRLPYDPSPVIFCLNEENGQKVITYCTKTKSGQVCEITRR